MCSAASRPTAAPRGLATNTKISTLTRSSLIRESGIRDRRPLRDDIPDAAAPNVSDFVEDADAGPWTTYVDSHPNGTLFHGLEWKRAVARTFGHRPRYLIARRDERVIGVLPMFDVRSVVASRMLVSMPYATYGGVLADDADAGGALIQAAIQLADQVGATTIDLRSEFAAAPNAPIVESHATFRRPLPTHVDEVASIFPRKARAAARQAETKFRLDVSFDSGALPIVWRLYSRSMRRLASPNYPLRFFESLRGALGDRFLTQVVRCDGQPVAGLITFLHRRTMMPYFLGLDERRSLYGLSHFVYLKCMAWGVANGYREFDFGRSRRENKGAFDFKRHCGFEPTILQYQRYVAPGARAPDLSPGSAKWAVARRVWRGLPLAITRPLGGWLAKSIPG
ncbi:MAG TPA: FemAB family PEP-CTERM system-associated protein [Phycisphaerae bacterium]|nr:FemAB family PEP-CTERM system-associated protein [Phycisphaerae bacterium]HRW53933.1 FemAB family PEP-CTERM system-associated protein [Phycisphaerae bacterium]